MTRMRPFVVSDGFFFAIFLLMTFIALFIDIINLIPGPVPITEKVLREMSWPPVGLLKQAWLVFASHVDPLLQANPTWFHSLFYPNIFSVIYYVIALAMIARGQFSSMRNASLVWAGHMLAILWVILFTELVGEPRTKNVPLLFVAYGIYVVVPILLIVRFSWFHEYDKDSKKKAN